MRKIFPAFLFLFPCLLFAQTVPVVIEGTITDIGNKPIAYSTIQNMESRNGTISDIRGYYIFRTFLPATLKVSYIGYKTEIRKINSLTGKDTLEIDFILSTDSTQLQQVVVTATNEPELIKESDNLTDFDMSNGNLLLLYQHSHGDQVIIYDSALHKSVTTQLKFHTDKLLRNEHSDIYCLHGDSLHFINYNHAANTLESFSFSKIYFDSFRPVKAYNPPYYYYEQKLEMNAGVNYTAYNPIKKEEKILYSYFDKTIFRDNTETYENILKLQNMILSLFGQFGSNASGLLRETQGQMLIQVAMIADFHSQINVMNDSIYIFNFNCDTFNIYDKHNTLKRKIPILFDQNKFGMSKKEILKDDNKKECYYKYEIRGITYLEKIDLNSGKAIKLQSIKFPFIEKLRISEGYAYYSCSNGGGSQPFVRHLYRQKIN